jgi:hypothetical protein
VTPLLEAKNVRKAFGRTEALRGASLCRSKPADREVVLRDGVVSSLPVLP